MNAPILAALLVSAIAAPPPTGPAGEARFRVTGRSLAEVLVDGGRLQGFGPGDRLRVLGGGDEQVAELEVVRVQERTASCRVVSVTRPVSAGDVVVRAAAPARPGLAAIVPTAAAIAPAKARPTGLAALAAPAVTPTPTPTPRAAATAGASTATPKLAPTPAPIAPPTPAPAAASKATPAPASMPAVAKDPPPPVLTPASKALASATRVTAVAAAPAAQSPTPTPAPALAVAPKTSPAPTPTPTVAKDPPATAVAVVTPAVAPAPVAASPAAPATPALAAPIKLAPGDGKTFTVRYRSAGNVYLDGGRSQGLDVGDRLQVTAGKTAVADLEVLYVAEQSASCRVTSETRPVQVGDSAVRVGRAVAAPPAVVQKAEPAAKAPPPPTLSSPSPPRITETSSGVASAPFARVRGSASLGYFQSSDHTGSGLGFTERTGRLDLTASDISGQPLSFTVRGRSRQDVRDRVLSDRTPVSERTDRLYEVALRYEPPSDSFSLEAGRIGIYRFVGIGYLDGALVRFRPVQNLHLGAFGGRAVEIEGLGFNGTGAKYGAFVQLAPGGRYSMAGYDALLAVVRETAEGDVSREYLSLESRYSRGRRFSLFERAEIDLNRGWRQEATGKSLQLSNVSLSGNLQVASSAWAYVSYDGRRNYRYFRNRLVPEEVFDDLLHQGLRGGLIISRPGGFGASAGFGMTLKEQDPRHPELNIANAYSFNGSLRHANLFGLSLGVDGSGFSNGYTEGVVVSARAGRRFRAGHVLDLSYGRSTYNVKATNEDRKTQWLRLMGRFELGRHAYLSGDVEYDQGDDLEGPRGLFEAGWIF